jgi:hypothetical protein
MTYSTASLYPITERTYRQSISRKALKNLHRVRKNFEKETADSLQSLHTKLRGNALRYENEISYTLCKSIPGKLGYGRYIGARGSLETLERGIRGSLCSMYYEDIDIVNCHPVLIVQMAKRYYNFNMPYQIGRAHV